MGVREIIQWLSALPGTLWMDLIQSPMPGEAQQYIFIYETCMQTNRSFEGEV